MAERKGDQALRGGGRTQPRDLIETFITEERIVCFKPECLGQWAGFIQQAIIRFRTEDRGSEP